jgi:hypothetical protein
VSFNAFQAFTGPIRLTIGPKTYTLPSVSAETGVRVTLIAERSAEIMRIAIANDEARQAAEKNGDPAPEPQELPDFDLKDILGEDGKPIDINRELLGDLYDEMVADGVPYEALVLAGQTATHDFLYGREAAEAYWNSGGDPKAVAEALPAANVFNRSTGAESTTPTPASTSGTKPQKKKSKN